MNLDIRDLVFWVKEAQERRIIKQVDDLSSVRISMGASNEKFNSLINELLGKLGSMRGTVDKIVKQNWENLRVRRRG